MSATSREADGPAEKADLLHAIYERITVAGPEIVGVRLTQAAYAHGLALALPEKVEMARPTGVGRALATYEIPIEGRALRIRSAGMRPPHTVDLSQFVAILGNGPVSRKMSEWKRTGPRTSVTSTPRRSSDARVRRMTRGIWQPLPISRYWRPTPASPVEIEARSWRRSSRPGDTC